MLSKVAQYAIEVKDRGSQVLRKAQQGWRDLARDVRETAESMRRGGSAGGALRSALDGVRSAARGAAAGLKRVAEGLMSIVRIDAASLFNAFRAALGSVLGVMTDFEAQMDAVQAVLRASSDQMEPLIARARELGATTRFSGTEAAQGMEELARAGLKATEILVGIAPTLRLAQAGALDLSKASEIAANIMRGLGKDAAELNNVVDILAAASASSSTNVEQLGQAFAKVVTVGRAAKVPMEVLAGAVGVLSDAGTKSEEAGVAIRNLIVNLIALKSPSAAQAQAMAELGLSAQQLNPELHGLVPVMQLLAERGVTTSQAFTLVDKRAGPAMLTLTQDLDRLKVLVDNFADVDGVAREMADTMDDNVQGAVKRVKSALQDLAIETGLLAPTFTDMLNQMANGARGSVGIVSGVAKGFVVIFETLNVGYALASTGMRTFRDTNVAILQDMVGKGAELAGKFAEFWNFGKENDLSRSLREAGNEFAAAADATRDKIGASYEELGVRLRGSMQRIADSFVGAGGLKSAAEIAADAIAKASKKTKKDVEDMADGGEVALSRFQKAWQKAITGMDEIAALTQQEFRDLLDLLRSDEFSFQTIAELIKVGDEETLARLRKEFDNLVGLLGTNAARIPGVLREQLEATASILGTELPATFNEIEVTANEAAQRVSPALTGMGRAAAEMGILFDKSGKQVKTGAENVQEGTIRFGEAGQRLAEANTAVKDGAEDLKKGAEQAGEAMEQAGTQAEQAGTQTQSLADQLKASAAEFRAAGSDAKAGAEQMAAGTEQAGASMERAKGQIEGVGAQTTDLAEQLKQAAAEFREVGSGIEEGGERAEAGADKIDAATAKVLEAAEKAGRTHDQIIQNADGSLTAWRHTADGWMEVSDQVEAGSIQIETGGQRASKGVDILIDRLTRLQDPSSQAAAVLKELGITADQLDPSVHSLADIFELLSEKGLDLEQAVSLIGMRGGPALTLLTQQVGPLQALSAAFGDTQVSASEAGNQIRHVVDRLIGLEEPTEGAAQALKELGITAEQLDPRTRSLAEIFELLAAKGLSLEQAMKLVGLGSSGALLELSQNADSLREVGGIFSETGASVKLMADSVTQAADSLETSGSKVDGAAETMKGAADKVGETRLVWEKTADGMHLVQKEVKDLSDATKNAATEVTGSAQAMADGLEAGAESAAASGTKAAQAGDGFREVAVKVGQSAAEVIKSAPQMGEAAKEAGAGLQEGGEQAKKGAAAMQDAASDVDQAASTIEDGAGRAADAGAAAADAAAASSETAAAAARDAAGATTEAGQAAGDLQATVADLRAQIQDLQAQVSTLQDTPLRVSVDLSEVYEARSEIALLVSDVVAAGSAVSGLNSGLQETFRTADEGI